MSRSELDGPAKQVIQSLIKALDKGDEQLVQARLGKLRGMLGKERLMARRTELRRMFTSEQRESLERMTGFRLL